MGIGKNEDAIYSIKQRKLFHSIEIKLYPEKLYYRNKSLSHEIKKEFPYEEVSNNNIYEKTNHKLLTAVSFMLAIALLKSLTSLSNGEAEVFLFLLVAEIACITAAYYNSTNYILIEASTPKFIFLYQNKPNEEEVNKFMIKYKSIVADYLKKNYVDNIPALQTEVKIAGIEHMKLRGFVSDKEAIAMKDSLKPELKVPSIGFNRN